MTKQHQDQFNTASLISNDQVPFDERGFTTQQTRQILAAGKTRFFEHILPELESYLEGTRRCRRTPMKNGNGAAAKAELRRNHFPGGSGDSGVPLQAKPLSVQTPFRPPLTPADTRRKQTP